MKKSIIAFVTLCGVIACAVVLLNRQNSLLRVSEPVVEPATAHASFSGTENTDVPKPEAPRIVSDQTAGPAAVASAQSVPADVKPAEPRRRIEPDGGRAALK